MPHLYVWTYLSELALNEVNSVNTNILRFDSELTQFINVM